MGIINYRYFDKSLKTIFFFILLSAAFNFTNVFLARKGIHTLFLFHIYAIFEFGCVSWFFKQQLTGLISKIIPALILIFSALCLFNFFYIQNKLELNTYTRSLESIIIIGYSIMFFNKQSQIDTKHSWGNYSLNWVNTSLLIFYSCSFFAFMIANYVANGDKVVAYIIWALYDTALLVENILFAIAFYKSKNQSIILNKTA